MGNFASLLIFTKLNQPLRNINGFLPVAGRLINLQELLERADTKICLINKLIEHIFRTVIHPCGHVVTAQLLNGKQSLVIRERRAFHQGLVNADSAIDFAARAEQVSEGKMGFDSAGILFEHVEEQVHRLILLVAQKQVHTGYVITR